jgi:hypothetical protein
MDGLMCWDEVERELNALARAAGIHSKGEAEFHAELDRLSELHPEWGIPTEAEALAWADAAGLP